MIFDTMDIQSELKDACHQVALDDSKRAELIDTAISNYIKYKESNDNIQALNKALDNPEVQTIFEQVDITEYTIESDGNLKISFSREFSGFNPDIIINGQMCILGRVASEVAERALDGEKVALVNSEEIVVTGDKNTVIDNFIDKSNKMPGYPQRPDKIVKRSIRGMLPHKQSRGRQALNRIRVYLGVPEMFQGNQRVPENKKVTLNPQKKKDFVTIGKIGESLGAKNRW